MSAFQEIDLRRFYEGQDESFLFSDAMEGFCYFKIDGMDAIKFMHVAGIVPNTIVAINAGDKVIQITGVNEKHKNDGIFSYLVSSVKTLDKE